MVTPKLNLKGWGCGEGGEASSGGGGLCRGQGRGIQGH